MNANLPPLVFSGSSCIELGGEIASILGVPQGKMHLSRFPDGEIKVEIQEDVRGRNVFILQSTGLEPCHYLMELLIIVDAVKRAAAQEIIAVIPYYAYSRQDRKDKSGVPITAKLIANMLSSAGVTRLIVLDLHSSQIEGFFEIPVDHHHCQSLLAEEVSSAITSPFTMVAPDIGSIKIVRRMSKLFDAEFVVMEKQRLSDHEVKINLLGDLKAKNVLIVDDMCSTAGTLVAAAALCKKLGAAKVVAAVTHGICSGEAISRINSSQIDLLLMTNTVPPGARFKDADKIKIISVGPLLARIIKEWTYTEESQKLGF